MLPQRPPQRTVGYEQAPATVQRTVGYEQAPKRTVGYEEAPKGHEQAIGRTLGYEEAPGEPASHRRAVGNDEARAGVAFDATLLEASPLPQAPTPPTNLPGAFATTIGQQSPLSLETLDASSVAGSQPSPSTSQGTRSTVLPRVELAEGQPRLTARDRPRYQEQKRLGEGGVGEVVMALDNDIERKVALKRLHPGLQGTTALARFVEEIRTVGQLEHPGIVPIHDVGLDERGQFYFVMKYVNGDTLEHIIERLAADDPAYHERYSIERRVEIFISILEAMSYAHDKGYIHRDIKPANVMVGPHGEVIVMDWGLAKQIGQTVDLAQKATDSNEPARSIRMQETRLGTILGTPYYMSPEQARGQHDTLDQRSDIYSLSMLFYELLALKHPLDDCSEITQVIHAVTTREPPAPDDRHAWGNNKTQGAVPAELRHFLRKGLQKDPAKRFHDVGEMIHRLRLRAEGCVDAECAITLWTSLLGKTRRQLERNPLKMATAFTLFSLVSLASMIFSVVHLLRA